ncbi:MAG: flagellar protein FliO/FliZ [Actinoplanes sp.]|nr:flagellar protein FliO/FliZ [Actinoplanes sp.]
MVELVLRIGFSLLIVFALMWGLARLIRRPLGGRRGAGALAVLSRQQLTRGSAVAIVQVHDRALILGITDQQVSLLGEAELGAFEPHPPHRDRLLVEPDGDLPAVQPSGRPDGSLVSPHTWESTLDFLRDRTTRR